MTRKDVIFRLNSSSSLLVCIASLKKVILLSRLRIRILKSSVVNAIDQKFCKISYLLIIIFKRLSYP